MMRSSCSAVLLSLVLFPPGARAACPLPLDLTCGFLECRAPANGVAPELWGNLRPTDTGQVAGNRDNTDFNEFTDPFNENQPHWMSLDVENGWIFTAINQGIQVWDARGGLAANPSRVKVVGRSGFPFWAPDPHEFYPVRDLDAPDGNANLLAVSQVGDGGLTIFDTTSKSSPVARYADKNKKGFEVYASRIAGNDYAFMASRDAGLLAYDMTAASALVSACTEDTPSQQGCGVYVGRLGASTVFQHVDGAGSASGTQHWVVGSFGAADDGLEIWDVSNPASPQLELTGLTGVNAMGVALWRNGSSYYLGLHSRQGPTNQARIYDVSCIASGSCGSLGAPVWTQALNGGASEHWVTYSSSGSSDFLYFGTVDRCLQVTQGEWLFDVSDPEQAFDITPPDVLYQGVPTGYWGWYYRRNATGFNRVMPRVGKFYGGYFYRAAFTLFDIHELNAPQAPTVSGVSALPNPATVCQEVTFTAQGVTGNPLPDFSWEVKDASSTVVATGGDVNPYLWDIPASTTPGAYTATVTATNSQGSAEATSPGVIVQGLPALGFAGPPTHDAFSGPTVQFHVDAPGATEWNWDFGDGTSTGWITDPVSGPNPEHTYTQIGDFTVTVSVRNCNEGPLESDPLMVSVTSLEILDILEFFVQGCSFNPCAYNAGIRLTFDISVSGDPDFYDYDWDGNGEYEQVSPFLVTEHTYTSTGLYRPALRVRRDVESVSLEHSRDIAIGVALPGIPAAPSNLQATPQSSTEIGLSWNDNSGGETGFEVEVTREGIYQGITVLAANTSSTVVTGLDPDTSYSFRVRAVNATGDSAWDGPVEATTQPTGLVFTDGFESGNISAWSGTVPP